MGAIPSGATLQNIGNYMKTHHTTLYYVTVITAVLLYFLVRIVLKAIALKRGFIRCDDDDDNEIWINFWPLAPIAGLFIGAMFCFYFAAMMPKKIIYKLFGVDLKEIEKRNDEYNNKLIDKYIKDE